VHGIARRLGAAGDGCEGVAEADVPVAVELFERLHRRREQRRPENL
jgi:hypothetical protein